MSDLNLNNLDDLSGNDDEFGGIGIYMRIGEDGEIIHLGHIFHKFGLVGMLRGAADDIERLLLVDWMKEQIEGEQNG